MLDEVKRGLIGRVITGVGIVNYAGERHARIQLDGDTLLVPLNNVMITLASRKPVGRASSALTMKAG